MTIRMNIQSDQPLEEGSYQAVLERLEKKGTKYGERLMWLFSVPDRGVEVAAFTSLSPSKQANAYRWATSLNGELADKTSWGTEDVVGRRCTLKVEVYEGEKGTKNKVVKVEPPRNPETG